MPARTLTDRLQTLRTGLWHLRTGGLRQLRTWHRRSLVQSYGVADGTASSDEDSGLTFASFVPPERSPRFGNLRAAVILDDFSMLAWSQEMDVVAVTPSEWREQLGENPVDLLLVESAWHGN